MSVNEIKGIKITLKLKSNGSTTQDIYLSDRPVLNDTNVGRWIPILQSASVGQVLSDYVPQDGAGTIIINNKMSSFAEQLRFSDWLEDYAIIGQPVKFYIANNAIGTDNFTSGLVEVWNDTIQSYTAGDDTITLTLKSNVLPQHVITYEVSKSQIDALSPTTVCPESSNGKFIPFVVGAGNYPEVQAVALGDVIGSNYVCWFAYATIFQGVFNVGGVNKYYAKNKKGKYSEVKSAPSSWFVYSWADNSNDYIEVSEGEFASRVNYDSANPYIVGGLTMRFRGNTANTAVTFAGDITIRIYERRADTGKPKKEPVIEASVQKSDYEAELEVNSEFEIIFTFPETLVMDWANGYWVSVSASDLETNGTVRFVTRDESGYRLQYRNHPDRRSTIAWKRGDDSSGTDKETDKTFVMKFHGIYLADDTNGISSLVNSNGLNTAVFSADINLVSGTSDGFKLTDLDIVVKTSGIATSGLGVVSAINHVFSILDYYWNGSTWTARGEYDSTFASASHAQTDNPASAYYRAIGGATSGRTRADQFMQKVCQELQCRICAVNGTARKWGLYVTGGAVTASDTLYDDDFKTISITATESGSIVNDVTIIYDKRLIDVELYKDQEIKGFAQTVNYNYADGGIGEGISEESFLLYGLKQLKNSGYEWIIDSASAQKTAELILRTHDQPFEFITIELPYYENRTLKAMDTLNLRTPKLWDLDGTTHNNNFNPLAKSNTFTNNSGTVIRAKSYKVQIINYQLVFDKNSVALYRLTCKLLTSANDPT